jgi:hypothetical protein
MGWFRDELVNNAYKFDFPFTNHSMSYLILKKNSFGQETVSRIK